MQTTHSHPIILLVPPIFGYMICNVLLHLSSLHFPNQPVVQLLAELESSPQKIFVW